MTEPQEEEADYIIDDDSTVSHEEANDIIEDDDPYELWSNGSEVVVNNDPAFKEVTEGVTWACSNRQLI